MKLTKVTHRSKLRGLTCALCRRVMREDEAAVVVGEMNYTRFVYHRDCVENLLADTPYEGNPSKAVLVEKQFSELQRQLAERYQTKDAS